MTSIVLFRGNLAEEGELEICQKHLLTMQSRMQIPRNSLVICRYSALPFYHELERDLKYLDSSMINSWQQHQFIADVMEWGSPEGVLAGLTPRSWREWGTLPEGAYILKGRTNSRKNQWQTHMFAPTKAAISEVARRLWDDSMISEQGLVVREYLPLRKLDEGINGLPITNEWRVFFLVDPRTQKPVLLTKGFYWQGSHPELEPLSKWSSEALDLAERAANLIAEHASFFVLDLAERENGEWIVVEVNDGQMSGLSGCNPEELYRNLAEILA